MKKFDSYRTELERLIVTHNYDMTNEIVIKKSLEIENKIYSEFQEV